MASKARAQDSISVAPISIDCGSGTLPTAGDALEFQIMLLSHLLVEDNDFGKVMPLSEGLMQVL